MNESLQEATTEARETMEAVFAALRAAGVDEQDIQTSGYNIWVERSFGPEGMADEGEAADAGGGAGPIAPGELQVTERIQITYTQR